MTDNPDREWLLHRQEQLKQQLIETEQQAVQPSCAACSPGDQASYEAALQKIERLKFQLAKIERRLD